MKNDDILLTAIRELQQIITSYEFKITHRKEAKHFSREGKIGFVNTILLMINFFKKTPFIEIYNFFDKIAKSNEIISRQAFEQAREKISHTAFLELFNKTVEIGLSTEDPKLYKGYRLLAIDGSTLMLENSEELKTHFGPTTPSEGDIFARISTLSDVLNCFVVDADIGPFTIGERKMAISHIEKLEKITDTQSIIITDRGYWSPEIISMVIKNKGKLLMRVASNVSKKLLNNPADKGKIKIKYNQKFYELRFYRFKLSSGAIETLVTNLDETEIDDNELAEIYFKRWGIETKYHELKTLLQIENFKGKTVLSVLQDFYTTVLLSNLVAFAKLQADESIQEKIRNKNLKYEYKANTNIAIGVLKDRLILAIIEKNPKKQYRIMQKVMKAITKNTVPIRTGRSYPRKESSLKYRKRTVSKSSL